MRLIREDLVVHLPELALLTGRHRRHRRGRRVGVERQRVVLPHHADVLAVVLLDLGDGRLDARAERALEVRELHDGDLGGLGAALGRAAHRHLVDRGRIGRRRLRRLGRLVGVGDGGARLGVASQRVVHLPGGDAGVDRLGGVGDLFVDHLLERLERLRAGERAAVDEERRRATRAELGGLILIGLDRRGVLRRVERFLDLGRVEPELARVLLQARAIERLLVLEQLVVRLPELALLVGGQRDLRRRGGVLVERQRVVLPRHADVLAVGLHDLIDRRLDARAERALEVGELDDGDLGLFRALDRRVADWHVVAIDARIGNRRGGNDRQRCVAVGALHVTAEEIPDGERDQHSDDGCTFAHGIKPFLNGADAPNRWCVRTQP